jgi:hypothetical protein
LFCFPAWPAPRLFNYFIGGALDRGGGKIDVDGNAGTKKNQQNHCSSSPHHSSII